MSRNKFVLGLAAIIIFYLLLPDSGFLGLIKAYMLAILPYALIFIIIWLLIAYYVGQYSMKFPKKF